MWPHHQTIAVSSLSSYGTSLAVLVLSTFYSIWLGKKFYALMCKRQISIILLCFLHFALLKFPLLHLNLSVLYPQLVCTLFCPALCYISLHIWIFYMHQQKVLPSFTSVSRLAKRQYPQSLDSTRTHSNLTIHVLQAETGLKTARVSCTHTNMHSYKNRKFYILAYL